MDHHSNGVTCFTYLRTHLFHVVLPIYVVVHIKPRNFIFTVSSIYFSLYPICNVECDEFLVMSYILFILSKPYNHTAEN